MNTLTITLFDHQNIEERIEVTDENFHVFVRAMSACLLNDQFCTF